MTRLTYWLTKLVALSCEPWEAGTCHSSKWESVIDFALSVGDTGSECCARIFAVSSIISNNANFFAWAIFVLFTSFIFYWFRY